MEQETRIRKEVTVSPVSIDKIYESDYQKKGTKTAQLRQKVMTKTFYPSTRVTNSHHDNPFTPEEFGFEEQEYDNTENRVTWIDVPEAISSKSEVAKKLPNDCVLYRVLSNRPIITDSQQYAIESDELDLTLDEIANKQVVRYSEGHEMEGQIVLDPNGKPQYRAIFFSMKPVEDQDLRNDIANDYYATDEIKAEVHGAHLVKQQELN